VTDILWSNTNGQASLWLMTSSSVTQVQVASANNLGVIPTSWSVALTSDLNGDGKSDILWRNSNGDASFWFMNGGQVLSTSDIGVVPTSWIVQGAAAD
jgi:hypothetical protein